MPSSSSDEMRPVGTHRVPRKGGRTLTKRLIRIEPDRRHEIDLHYLGRALLRLAQEQYDVERTRRHTVAAAPEEAPAPPHEPRRRPNGPPRDPDRGTAPHAPVRRNPGATG